jgi:hypothetical protein
MTTGDETTMAGRHPAPPVPGGTVPPSSAAPEPGTSAALVPGASAAPLTVADRAGGAARRVAGAAAELWLHPDRLVHSVWHGRPGSMADHRAYVKSRAWVPPEMTGNPEKAVVIAGIAYHLVIARPLKLAAKTLDASADRPLRLFGLIAFLAFLVLLLIHL